MLHHSRPAPEVDVIGPAVIKHTPERRRRTPFDPPKVSLSPSSGRTTLTLWSICVLCCKMCGTMSRSFTSLPPRSPPPTSNGARAHSTVEFNGAAAPSPSSTLPPPHAHALQAPADAAASARAAPDAGIFDGVPSIPGDLVDLLTRNGTFEFLEDLHETGRLWDLRNFRIPRLVPRGAASKDFGDGLKADLALAERCPAQSLSLYILRAFAQFLPVLLMPCSRHGKLRHVSLNACHFQKGSGSPFGIRHRNTTTTSWPIGRRS
jgi:hypothetical protein